MESDITCMKLYYEQYLDIDSLPDIVRSASPRSTATLDSPRVKLCENEEVDRNLCNVGIPHSVVSTHCNVYTAHCTELVECNAMDNALLSLHEYGMREDHANSRQAEMMSIKAEPNSCISNDVAVKIELADEFTSRLQSNKVLKIAGMSYSGQVLKSEANDNDEISVHEHIDTYCFSSNNTNTIIPDDYTLVKQEIIDYDFDANGEAVKAPCLFEDFHIVKLERELHAEDKCSPMTTSNIHSNMDNVCPSTQIYEQSVKPFEMVSIKDKIDDALNIAKLMCEYSDEDSNQCTYQAVTHPHSNEQPFVEIEIIKDELGKCTELNQTNALDKTTRCVKLSSDGMPTTESMKIVSSTKRKLKDGQNTIKKFACTECDSYYFSKSGYVKHRIVKHGDSGSYKCGNCFKISATRYDQERHSKSCVKGHCKSSSKDHKNTLLPCTECGTAFVGKHRLDRHMIIHNKFETGICVAFQDGFSNETATVIRTKTTKKSTVSVHSIKSHKIYKCIVCGKILSSEHNLNQHTRLHTGERPYKCTICGKTSTQKRAHDVHMMIHTGEKPFNCSECLRSFRYLPDWKKHSLVCSQIECVTCEHCSRIFSNQKAYEEHLRMHAKHRPYQCTKCEKSYLSVTHLQRHQLVHTSKKIYQCFICERSFGHSHHLHRHMKSHHNESIGLARHSCHLCGKEFDDLETFKEHQRVIHKCNYKEREMFNCEECGMEFITKAGLGVHTYKKHAYSLNNECAHAKNMLAQLLFKTDTPHDDTLCPICNVHFSTATNLNRHFRRKHMHKANSI